MFREARVSTFWFTMKNEGLQRIARVTTFLVKKKKKEDVYKEERFSTFLVQK